MSKNCGRAVDCSRTKDCATTVEIIAITEKRQKKIIFLLRMITPMKEKTFVKISPKILLATYFLM